MCGVVLATAERFDISLFGGNGMIGAPGAIVLSRLPQRYCWTWDGGFHHNPVS